MSLVPSENCQQAQHMIHPNIPFLSIKESKKRGAKFHTDLTSPKSWKLVLLITHDSVWYKDEISGITKKVDVLQNGKTRLSESVDVIYATTFWHHQMS